MKKILCIALFFSVAFTQQQTLTILHWNDVHSQNIPFQVKTKSKATNADTTYMVGGSAILASYIKKHHQGGSATLLLCAGDDFQGSPVSAITKGNSQIQLLNLLQPHAFALGNHEFDYGRESLTENIAQANFPVLSANLYDTTTSQPYTKQFIVQPFGNMNVGIIGLITEELPTLSLPDNVKHLKVMPLATTVHSLVPTLKKLGADIIIALTHQGVKEDSLLAVHAPDIDVIIGGHSHTPLFKPKYVNGVVIAQAGSRGRWLGKVELTVDTEKDTILNSTGELVECRAADILPDSVVAKKVAELEQLADKRLSKVVAELKTDWKRNNREESNIGNWICDAMRNYANTDIAFQNSGGIRKEALAGNLTVRDFWEISPFGNTLVKFSIDGKTLRSMIEHQLSLNDDFCQVSGLQITYSVQHGQRILKDVTVRTKPLQPKQMYSIVTNNYVAAQAKKYFGIEIPDTLITPLHVLDRDILIAAAKQQRVISSSVEGRIKEVK